MGTILCYQGPYNIPLSTSYISTYLAVDDQLTMSDDYLSYLRSAPGCRFTHGRLTFLSLVSTLIDHA